MMAFQPNAALVLTHRGRSKSFDDLATLITNGFALQVDAVLIEVLFPDRLRPRWAMVILPVESKRACCALSTFAASHTDVSRHSPARVRRARRLAQQPIRIAGVGDTARPCTVRACVLLDVAGVVDVRAPIAESARDILLVTDPAFLKMKSRPSSRRAGPEVAVLHDPAEVDSLDDRRIFGAYFGSLTA